MGTKVINTLHHRVEQAVPGHGRVRIGAGHVQELDGPLLDAALALPGVRSASNAEADAAYEASSGATEHLPVEPSCSVLSEDEVRTLRSLGPGHAPLGQVRDGVDVAFQPSVGATGGGHPSHADEKASQDTVGVITTAAFAGAPTPPDEEQGDPLEQLDVDGLKAHAEANGIDIGNASSENGIRKKIAEHYAAADEE